MDLTTRTERMGFAPSEYVCPYHIWKPKGVLRGCTCSPPPDHQIKWEEKLFVSGEGAVLRRFPIESGSAVGRSFIGGIGRRNIAIICRSSGQALISALRSARKGLAGRFLYVRDVVRSKQSC
jgi:hypothetical protein